MIPALYILCCGLFFKAFTVTRLLPVTKQLAGVFHEAYSVVTDKALSDLEKEKRVRALTLVSAKGAVNLTLRLILVVGVSALPALFADALNAAAFGDVVAFALHPAVILATIVVFWVLARRKRPSTVD